MEQENKPKFNPGVLLVFILTVGVFGIINTEMGVVGILPLIAEKFQVSVPQAGWTVSLFALVVAVSAPVTPLLFSGINRKKMMLVALGVFTCSNVISMLTSDFTVLLVARILPAFLHPVYVSMALTVAGASAGEGKAPRAVAKVFIGVSAGMVLGVPVTSFIASEVSFSMAMLFFTLVNALVFIATILFVPSMPVKEKLSYGKQLSVLRKTGVWYSVLAVTLINGAMFGVFSYLSDFLRNVTEISYPLISLVLLVYGLANMAGNILAGRLLSVNAARCTMAVPLVLLLAYIGLFMMGEWTVITVLLVLGLGVLAGIATNSMQYMIITAAPEAPDFANGLFLTAANLGTTLGTTICGIFITSLGTRYAVFGALLFLVLSIVFVFLRIINFLNKKCMKQVSALVLAVFMMPAASFAQTGADNFYQSNLVNMEKVSFLNQYKMKVAGNLFLPKAMKAGEKYPAIIVGHPMGAVKEQSANLYATKMAERGFVTLALDLSYWGESEGEPRNAVLPDVYAEDFSAAADFLGTRPFIDRERMGVIGICGSGSFAISAAKIDPRLKAVATVSMYDMGTASRDGLKHALTPAQRKQIIAEAAEQRYAEFLGEETKYTGGTVHELTEKSTPIEREFYEFYRTSRGEVTPEGQSPLHTTHPTLTSNVKFMNFYPFSGMETISPRPMLFIAGENAHSREFSEEAYRLAAEPKELCIVPGAGHVDLYDRVNLIPFDRLDSFFKESLR